MQVKKNAEPGCKSHQPEKEKRRKQGGGKSGEAYELACGLFVPGQHDGVFVGAGGEEGEQDAKRMKQRKKAEFLGCVEAREDWTGRQRNKMRRQGAGAEVGNVGSKRAGSEAVEEGSHGFLVVAVDGRGLRNALPRVDVFVVGLEDSQIQG